MKAAIKDLCQFVQDANVKDDVFSNFLTKRDNMNVPATKNTTSDKGNECYDYVQILSLI